MLYAGFWKRFFSYWLDLIVMIPIIALSFWGNEQSRLFHLYYLLPSLAFSIWFHVYLVKRFGGTPGKLLMGIKIAKLDGSAAGYKEASLRYSVLFVISILSSVPIVMVSLGMTDAEYFSMGWQERTAAMVERAPFWYGYVSISMNIWVWGEFIVMFTNKKRRAVHDFIAGTVVIQKSVPNKSILQDKKLLVCLQPR